MDQTPSSPDRLPIDPAGVTEPQNDLPPLGDNDSWTGPDAAPSETVAAQHNMPLEVGIGGMDELSDDDEKAIILQDRLCRVRDVFGAFHFTVESYLRQRRGLSEATQAEVERMAEASWTRTQGLIVEFLNGDEAQDGMSVDELCVRALRVITEDYLVRVEPILKGEPGQDTIAEGEDDALGGNDVNDLDGADVEPISSED